MGGLSGRVKYVGAVGEYGCVKYVGADKVGG